MLSTEGEPIIKNGKMVVERFILVLPENFGNTEITAILIMISGIVSIWLVEWLAKKINTYYGYIRTNWEIFSS